MSSWMLQSPSWTLVSAGNVPSFTCGPAASPVLHEFPNLQCCKLGQCEEGHLEHNNYVSTDAHRQIRLASRVIGRALRSCVCPSLEPPCAQRFGQGNALRKTIFELIAAELLKSVPLPTPDPSVHQPSQHGGSVHGPSFFRCELTSRCAQPHYFQMIRRMGVTEPAASSFAIHDDAPCIL